VVRFRSSSKKPLKIPHIGWNTIAIDASFKSPFLRGIQENEYFYFVHSFFPAPKDRSLIVAKTQYGQSFCSAIEGRNLFACQFHPEKSGKKGVRILSNFTKRVMAC
jgi:glutamine amidotransferase